MRRGSGRSKRRHRGNTLHRHPVRRLRRADVRPRRTAATSLSVETTDHDADSPRGSLNFTGNPFGINLLSDDTSGDGEFVPVRPGHRGRQQRHLPRHRRRGQQRHHSPGARLRGLPDPARHIIFGRRDSNPERRRLKRHRHRRSTATTRSPSLREARRDHRYRDGRHRRRSDDPPDGRTYGTSATPTAESGPAKAPTAQGTPARSIYGGTGSSNTEIGTPIILKAYGDPGGSDATHPTQVTNLLSALRQASTASRRSRQGQGSGTSRRCSTHTTTAPGTRSSRSTSRQQASA